MGSVNDSAASTVKLAASDLTFLWSQCRRCFWLKARGVLKRPQSPFPKIFGRLDMQTKDFFAGKRTEEMAPGLRPGRVGMGDRWVRSRPLKVPAHRTAVVLGGRIDTALFYDDGSYAIIDFKVTGPSEEHVPFYGRQMHSYALAAENPAPGALTLRPVTTLGLLCVEPFSMVDLGDGVAYRGETEFIEIPRDDEAFLAFLSDVLFLLEQSEPPPPADSCSYCSYLAVGSLVLLTGHYKRSQ